MKPKLSDWQPLDLVDKEAIQPLRSFNSRVAAGDQRYYTLDNDNSAVCVAESDDDRDSVTSDVEFYRADPIDDKATKRLQRRWRRLMLFVVVSVVLIICLVIVVIYQHNKSKDDKVSGKCLSPDCVRNAAYIMNKMDTKVDPCSDFYEFSCGNWEKNVVVPGSKAKYGSFSMIGDEIQKIMKEVLEGDEKPSKGDQSTAMHKARLFYNMCMDENKLEQVGVTPALELIRDLGSWTLTSDETSGTFDPTTWTIQDGLLLSHRLDYSALFSMGLVTDNRNSSQYIIGFEQSGLTLSDPKEYFTNHTKYQELKDAFLKFGTDIVTLLGGSDNVEQKMADLYDFEQKIANIYVPKEEMIDPEKTYNKMTLQDFQDKYMGTWLNLSTYIHGMFVNIATISMDTEVVVYTPTYFQKLDTLVKATDKETLANYFVWHTVSAITGYLTKDILAAALELDKVESGLKEYPVRWKRCISKTTSTYGYATGALYVDKYFTQKDKTDVESYLEEVRTAFIANLEGLEWMDKTTKSYAEEKAEAVTKMLGYPEYIMDPVKLDKYYENFTLVEGKLFESHTSIKQASLQRNLLRYGTVPDRTEWSMVPTEVNGYYSADFNHIVFPAGILRPPLYNPTSPKSFNFGSFGMICGHELTHGFDNKGGKFDKFGNMRNWWTNSSAEMFDEKTKCFEDFYSNYTVGGTHLNGKTTLGENIADNGGMKVAYLAYQTWLDKHGGHDDIQLPGITYNSDQLFFIGMAQLWCSHYTPEYMQQAILTDPHSIAKYRVLAPMSNSKFFAEAFQCPANSKMNPSSKCSVW